MRALECPTATSKTRPTNSDHIFIAGLLPCPVGHLAEVNDHALEIDGIPIAPSLHDLAANGASRATVAAH
jgi:hypothetical protein